MLKLLKDISQNSDTELRSEEEAGDCRLYFKEGDFFHAGVQKEAGGVEQRQTGWPAKICQPHLEPYFQFIYLNNLCLKINKDVVDEKRVYNVFV